MGTCLFEESVDLVKHWLESGKVFLVKKGIREEFDYFRVIKFTILNQIGL